MAARLQEHLAGGKVPGYTAPLLVYNRTVEVAERFAAATPGVTVARSVANVAAARPAVIFCMLANDTATDAVLGQLLEAVQQLPKAAGGGGVPSIFVNCATLLPATVARQAAQAAAAGLLYANCPVFGRPDAAAAGQLVAVPAGSPYARKCLVPLLGAFAGRGVWDLGDDPAASAALKLVSGQLPGGLAVLGWRCWAGDQGCAVQCWCSGCAAQLPVQLVTLLPMPASRLPRLYRLATRS